KYGRLQREECAGGSRLCPFAGPGRQFYHRSARRAIAVSRTGYSNYDPRSKGGVMKRIKWTAPISLAAAALVWAGCASATPPAGATAKATLESKSGSSVTGTATFTELRTGGVRARVHIEHATPGTHGLHIHEKGDCSD